MSVWYGISYDGTTGSPNFSFSTFSLSSFPIGTDSCIMFGICIIIFFIFPAYSSSSFSFSTNFWFISFTCSFTLSASSFWPFLIRFPIWSLKEFLCALNSSPLHFTLLLFSSSSITSSTNGSFSSWNLFFMFCFTISGFSLKNLMSIIKFPPLNTKNHPYKTIRAIYFRGTTLIYNTCDFSSLIS